MSSRHVQLSERQERFIAQRVASGRHRDADSVLQAGLELLERRESEDAAVRQAVAADIDAGDFTVIRDQADLERFFAATSAEIEDSPES